MPAIPERYNTEINEMLLNPLEANPFAHGFNLASESQSHSESSDKGSVPNAS